jgi:hypothetical protein
MPARSAGSPSAEASAGCAPPCPAPGAPEGPAAKLGGPAAPGAEGPAAGAALWAAGGRAAAGPTAAGGAAEGAPELLGGWGAGSAAGGAAWAAEVEVDAADRAPELEVRAMPLALALAPVRLEAPGGTNCGALGLSCAAGWRGRGAVSAAWAVRHPGAGVAAVAQPRAAQRKRAAQQPPQPSSPPWSWRCRRACWASRAARSATQRTPGASPASAPTPAAG